MTTYQPAGGVRVGYYALLIASFAVCGWVLVGCSHAAEVMLGPNDLSDDYVRSRIDEEYSIAQTCTALGQMRDDGGVLHPESKTLLARETALRLDLVLRAANIDAPHCSLGALESMSDCGAEPSHCPSDARTCRLEIEAALKADEAKSKGGVGAASKGSVDRDVLAVVGFSFDGRVGDPVKASALGGRELTTESASVARRVNTAYATVLTMVAISRRAEQMAADLSASFGWFQGFARPLLDLAAADVVAASMDSLLDRLEREQAVTKASVSGQACRVYDRADPTALVTSRVLRRAILRFSSADYARVAEPMRACRELERSSRKAGRSAAESAVCTQMLTRLPGRRAELNPRLGRPTIEFTRADPRHVEALRVAAHACIARAPTDSAPCTLERVERVASMLAAQSSNGRSPSPTDADTADFAALESQLSAIGDRLLVVERKLDDVRQRVDGLSAEAQSGDERLVSTQDRIDTRLDLLERRLVRDTMLFAGRAGKACRQYVDATLDARNRLADELDLRNDRGESVKSPCSGYAEESPAAGDQRFTSVRFAGATVEREAFCGGRFVALSFEIGYEPSAVEPSAQGREALAWLGGKLHEGDSISLLASGGDALWSRSLTKAFQSLPSDVRAKYGAELGVPEELAVVRAETALALLPRLPASVSIAGRASRKLEIAVLLGGTLAFDPMANCPSWPK